MDRQERRGWYGFLYWVGMLAVGWRYRVKVLGRENIPEGAVLVCANHTKWYDPLLVAMALGPKHRLHYMAKAELFRKPLAAFFLKRLCAFPVVRGQNDMGAIHKAQELLDNGEKVGMFPEGTRCKEDWAVRPKTGAVRIAAAAGAPLLPIYIPRDRDLHHKIPVVIGEAYTQNTAVTVPAAEFHDLADTLMRKIYALGERL